MMPGAKVNLLIVDDEPSIRRTFSEIFTEFGYSVRSAEDGFTALVAIGREIPDILLSDLAADCGRHGPPERAVVSPASQRVSACRGSEQRARLFRIYAHWTYLPEVLKGVFKRSRQSHLSCARIWLRLLLQFRFVMQPPSRNTWRLRRLFGWSQTCGSSRLRECPISTREPNKKELPRCAR
jgi:hypothetical protein